MSEKSKEYSEAGSSQNFALDLSLSSTQDESEEEIIEEVDEDGEDSFQFEFVPGTETEPELESIQTNSPPAELSDEEVDVTEVDGEASPALPPPSPPREEPRHSLTPPKVLPSSKKKRRHSLSDESLTPKKCDTPKKSPKKAKRIEEEPSEAPTVVLQDHSSDSTPTSSGPRRFPRPRRRNKCKDPKANLNQVDLTPAEWEEAVKTSFRYKELAIRVATRVRVCSAKDQLPVQCGKCETQFDAKKGGVGKHLKQHVLTHLPPAPFRCPLCLQTTRNPASHHMSKHDNVGSLPHGILIIRPEIVEEAIQNLFECFPREEGETEEEGDMLENGPPFLEGIERAQRYENYARRVAYEIGIHAKAGNKIECGECGRSFNHLTKDIARATRRHVLTHLSSPAYRCKICGKVANITKDHMLYEHPEERQKLPRDYVELIREEMAEEALDNLFLCFPEFSWVRELPDPTEGGLRKFFKKGKDVQLETTMTEEGNISVATQSFLAKKTMLGLNETGEASTSAMTEAEVEEKTLLYERLSKTVASEIRKYIVDNPLASIQCSKCTRIYGSESLGYLTSSVKRHFLTHLSENPFQCPVCGATIPEKWSCHLKKYHPEEMKKKDLVQRVTRVRPAMLEEALDIIFQCYPAFKYVKNMTLKNLDTRRSSLLEKTTTRKLTKEESEVVERAIEETANGEEINSREHLVNLAHRHNAFHLKVSTEIRDKFNEGDSVKCGLCGKEFPGKDCQVPMRHAVSHITVKAYQCRTCDMICTNIPYHYKTKHSPLVPEKDERDIVRAEAAKEAVRTLFQCFPEFYWVSQLSPQELNTPTRRVAVHRISKAQKQTESPARIPNQRPGGSVITATNLPTMQNTFQPIIYPPTPVIHFNDNY